MDEFDESETRQRVSRIASEETVLRLIKINCLTAF